jgi:hypothetical protein
LLSKIKDKEWLLLECQRRIPYDVQGAKLLLEYGLKLTQGYGTHYLLVTLPQSQRTEDAVLHRLLYLNYIERLQTYAAVTEGN